MVELPQKSCDTLARDALEIIRFPVEVRLSSDVMRRLEASRRRLLEEARKRTIYGYHTRFGELVGESAGRGEKWEEIVVEEHSVTTGPGVAPPGLVRLFLLLRLNQLLQMPAPVRPVVADRLASALRLDILPLILPHGSVGASGDLAPSAQAVRCLFYGRGEAYYGGARVPCSEALEKAGLKYPLPLEKAEALMLINNTAWSTALCLAAHSVLRRLIDEAVNLLARTVSITGANREHYHPGVLRAKRCPMGEKIALHLEGYASHEPRNLQSPYSIRCIPQVVGATLRLVEFARQLLIEEACASTENPVVVEDRVFHACNFHSIKVAYACQTMATALGYLSALLERVGAQLLRGKITGLPEHLAGQNSSVGAMILHYTMAAHSARVRQLSSPTLTYTTPTSGLQEDVVPMTPEEGVKVIEQLRHTAPLLAALKVILDRADSVRGGDARPLVGVQELLRAAEEEIVEASGLDLLNGLQ